MANESKKEQKKYYKKYYKNLEKFTKKGDSPVELLKCFSNIKETFLENWGVPSSNFKHFL